MNKYKISIYSLISCALFFAVFKPYFLPDAIRQASKIIILAGVFIFVITNMKLNKLINCSLIFASCVILSAIVAIFNRNYEIRDFLDSILYALTFYDLYTFAKLCKYKGYSQKLISSMFRMNLLYCILTVFSVAIVGVENNSNTVAYLLEINLPRRIYLYFLLLYMGLHMKRIKKEIN